MFINVAEGLQEKKENWENSTPSLPQTSYLRQEKSLKQNFFIADH